MDGQDKQDKGFQISNLKSKYKLSSCLSCPSMLILLKVERAGTSPAPTVLLLFAVGGER
jgi:hypothetical protein